MEINGEQIIKKVVKIPLWIIMVYIISILVIIVSIFWINYIKRTETPEPINFTTNGTIGMETEQYAYLNIQGLTSEVAIYGDLDNENSSSNDRYYIAINEGYMYIVDLNFKTIELLKPWQEYFYSEDENVKTPKEVTIYGMTESIPNELKYIILDYYNESVSEEQQISINDFENYFGSVLLNVRKEPVDTSAQRALIILGVFGIILISTIHIDIAIQKNKVKKYLKENGYEDDIIYELNNCIEEMHYKNKIILTKNFFVDLNNKLAIFKFSDVKWAHIHNIKSYGITGISELFIYLKDGKTKLTCLKIKGEVTEEFIGILNKIFKNASNDCLRGYTHENFRAFAQYKKDVKKNNI